MHTEVPGRRGRALRHRRPAGASFWVWVPLGFPSPWPVSRDPGRVCRCPQPRAVRLRAASSGLSSALPPRFLPLWPLSTRPAGWRLGPASQEGRGVVAIAVEPLGFSSLGATLLHGCVTCSTFPKARFLPGTDKELSDTEEDPLPSNKCKKVRGLSLLGREQGGAQCGAATLSPGCRGHCKRRGCGPKVLSWTPRSLVPTGFAPRLATLDKQVDGGTRPLTPTHPGLCVPSSGHRTRHPWAGHTD